jgi:hypothetical protein
MSTDGRYMLVYENLGYLKPTPMEKDEEYLKEKYGGEFTKIQCSTIFWDKPKYLLPHEELKNLHAVQILERQDCELWEIIK